MLRELIIQEILNMHPTTPSMRWDGLAVFLCSLDYTDFDSMKRKKQRELMEKCSLMDYPYDKLSDETLLKVLMYASRLFNRCM